MSNATLTRETFRTSRLLDFVSEKELVAQIGHQRAAWPLVLLKELLDNSLDACEEANIDPEVMITVDERGVSVTDNGPGIPPDVVGDILDYSVRVSSREAYVSPCRGAQGNALKTVLAMPYVLDGDSGHVTIRALGICHEITLCVDRIQQRPVIKHEQHPDDQFVKNGTSVSVHLACSQPGADGDNLENGAEADRDLACSFLRGAKARFLQIADDFTYLNPHLTLRCDWCGDRVLDVPASAPGWWKWRPSDPTSPHWYEPEHFSRLTGAHLAHGKYKTVRELVAEFRGLSGTAKQKKVLGATGLHRAPLSALINGDGKSLDGALVEKLLTAMKAESKPVEPAALGAIGKDHLWAKFKSLGCEMESFDYRKVKGKTHNLPWIVETAFAWCPKSRGRRIITGVNWSPGIINPFRELGSFGQSLDSILEQQRAGAEEPVVLLLHLSCPRVQFADRGKSSVVVES